VTRTRHLIALGLGALLAAGVLRRLGRTTFPDHDDESPAESQSPPAHAWEGPLRHIVHGAERGGVSTSALVADETTLYDNFQLGMELLRSGNPAQAAVRLERARHGAPRKASVREALGRAYFQLGRLKDAEGEFRTVVEVDPTNDYAHFCLSRVLQRRGRFKQADVHLKLARAMSPDEERYRRWSEN
jgi:Flp pilus assembly protein TadD